MFQVGKAWEGARYKDLVQPMLVRVYRGEEMPIDYPLDPEDVLAEYWIAGVLTKKHQQGIGTKGQPLYQALLLDTAKMDVGNTLEIDLNISWYRK